MKSKLSEKAAFLFYLNMKAIISVLLLVFSGSTMCSQTVLDTDGLNNVDNVFLYALKEYCKTLNRDMTKNVYVKKEYPVGESWPKEIEGLEIIYLSTEKEYRNAIKSNGGNIRVIGINSLDLRKGDFYVAVIPFSVIYKRGAIHLTNGGGWIVYFDYDSEKRGLIYRSKKNFGI